MLEQLTFVMPEITIALFASVILILDLLKLKFGYKVIHVFALFGLLVAGFFTIKIANVNTNSTSLFVNSYIIDNFSVLIKLLFFIITAVIFVYSRPYLLIRNSYSGEYYSLCMFSLLGMMILISSANFLSLYLGLELFALPLYALICYVKDNKYAPEAAIKYFIMGAVASGLLLYGMSLIYGASGSIDLTVLSNFSSASINGDNSIKLIMQFGAMFMLAGIAFKLGAVPFHMWVPDTYQGASTPITLLISTSPKIAAFGMAFRVLDGGFSNATEYWQPIIMVMAVASIIIGNIAAIMQTNLKRLLAYSTIGHIGFMLLGILVAPNVGYSAALFYMIIYVITTLAAFGIIILLSKHGFESDKISDFQGLATTHPWIAFLMLLVLFSLAGIPPLAGFYAKFLIIKELISSSLISLAVIAVIFSVIASFYYLKVIKAMFFDKPKSDDTYPLVSMTFSGKLILSFNSISLLVIGILPLPVMLFCEYIV